MIPLKYFFWYFLKIVLIIFKIAGFFWKLFDYFENCFIYFFKKILPIPLKLFWFFWKLCDSFKSVCFLKKVFCHRLFAAPLHPLDSPRVNPMLDSFYFNFLISVVFMFLRTLLISFRHALFGLGFSDDNFPVCILLRNNTPYDGS